MKKVSELMSLKGRVAVVTGGAGKIAEAIEEVLADLGAKLCILDIAADSAEQRRQSLSKSFTVEASAFSADVSQEFSVQRAVAAAAERYGGIDILVNNAAYPPINLPADHRELESQHLEQWNANVGVMLTGAFLVTRACLP